MTTREDIAFIKKWFGNKTDVSGRSLWRHAVSVAENLERTANEGGEIDPPTLTKLYRAALGHDLLEDTEVPEREIEQRWGEEVLQHIKDLSNPHGDSDVGFYIEHLRAASEEVLLVKFADILSNLSNSVRNFDDLDIEWVRTFWSPLVKLYEENLFDREFSRFPKTAGSLVEEMRKLSSELSKKLSPAERRTQSGR